MRELGGARHGVADRGSALRREVRERVADELPVAGDGRGHLGVAGERDQPDAELRRQPVEELADGVLRGLEAGRLDVLGEHRARTRRSPGRSSPARACAGRSSAGAPCAAVAAASASRNRTGAIQRRQLPRRSTTARQHVEVRERDRVARRSAAHEHVRDQHRGHERQRDQGERPLERHGPPLAQSSCTWSSTRIAERHGNVRCTVRDRPAALPAQLHVHAAQHASGSAAGLVRKPTA